MSTRTYSTTTTATTTLAPPVVRIRRIGGGGRGRRMGKRRRTREEGLRFLTQRTWECEMSRSQSNRSYSRTASSRRILACATRTHAAASRHCRRLVPGSKFYATRARLGERLLAPDLGHVLGCSPNPGRRVCTYCRRRTDRRSSPPSSLTRSWTWTCLRTTTTWSHGQQ